MSCIQSECPVTAVLRYVTSTRLYFMQAVYKPARAVCSLLARLHDTASNLSHHRLPSGLTTDSTALWLVRFFWASRFLFSVSSLVFFVWFRPCGRLSWLFASFRAHVNIFHRFIVSLYNQFDNRLYRVNKHPTGWQTGLTTLPLTDANSHWSTHVSNAHWVCADSVPLWPSTIPIQSSLRLLDNSRMPPATWRA